MTDTMPATLALDPASRSTTARVGLALTEPFVAELGSNAHERARAVVAGLLYLAGLTAAARATGEPEPPAELAMALASEARWGMHRAYVRWRQEEAKGGR